MNRVVGTDIIVGFIAGAGLTGLVSAASLLRMRRVPAVPSGDDGLATALMQVAASSQAQAESMGRLAVMTAESVRLAGGSYVFELRDRFDAALPPASVGVSHTELTSGTDLGPIELLVFHPGDHVRADVRIAVSQAPVRRIISARWDHLPERCDARTPTFAAAGGQPLADGSWELPSDVSLFVDLVLDLDIGSLAPGAIETKGRLLIEVTNTRSEGAVAMIPVDVRLAALIVPDDDGVGLDVPVVNAVVGPEQRTYLLEKSTAMVLELPRLRELT